jgi:hypothetical protein
MVDVVEDEYEPASLEIAPAATASVRTDGEVAAPPLEVHDLCKRYEGGVWANRDINLTGNSGDTGS